MTGKALKKSGQKLSAAQLTELCQAARRGLRDLQTPEEHIEALLERLKAAYKANRLDECARTFRHILETCSSEIEKLGTRQDPDAAKNKTRRGKGTGRGKKD